MERWGKGREEGDVSGNPVVHLEMNVNLFRKISAVSDVRKHPENGCVSRGTCLYCR